MLNCKQNQYIWDGHVEQLQALRKDRIYPWFLNLHSEEREYIYIYDRMYQIYLGNCIFIHVYIYIHTHTHNLWMFFSITFTWCLFFCSKLLHLIFATTMSSGLGLCKVFLWIFAGKPGPQTSAKRRRIARAYWGANNVTTQWGLASHRKKQFMDATKQFFKLFVGSFF